MALTVTVALFATGCETVRSYKPLSATDAKDVRSVEVLVQPIEQNVAVVSQSTIVHVVPGAGVSAGSAAGTGLLASLIVSGVSAAVAGSAERGLAPLSEAVIDLKPAQAFHSRLLVSPAPRVAIHPASRVLDQRIEDADLQEAAGRSPADAILLIGFRPFFPTNSHTPTYVATARLIGRDGRLLARETLTLVGPKADGGSAGEHAEWWIEDDRYRRSLQLAIEALTIGVRREVLDPERLLSEAEVKAQLDAILSDAPLPVRAEDEPAFPHCALDDRPIRFVFTRTIYARLVHIECRIDDGNVNATPNASPFVWATDWQTVSGLGALAKAPGSVAAAPLTTQFKVGDRLVYKDTVPATGNSAAEHSLQVSRINAASLEFNGGRARVTVRGRVSGDIRRPYLLQSIPAKATTGASWSGQYFIDDRSVPGTTTQLALQSIEQKDISGIRFKAARVAISGYSHAADKTQTNPAGGTDISAHFEGEAWIDTESGVMLAVRLTSRSPQYNLKRELIRIER